MRLVDRAALAQPPEIGRGRGLAGDRPGRVDPRLEGVKGDPRSASTDIAATMSAARQPLGVEQASASTAVLACVPLMRARPSFGRSVTAERPAHARRPIRGHAGPFSVVEHASLAHENERQVRERRQIAACADRAATRHSRMTTPAFNSTAARRASRAEPRVALGEHIGPQRHDARTTQGGSGSPTPPRHDCEADSVAARRATRWGSHASASAPKPVLTPYTGAPPAACDRRSARGLDTLAPRRHSGRPVHRRSAIRSSASSVRDSPSSQHHRGRIYARDMNIACWAPSGATKAKGKIVDLLTPHFDMVARYQGGHNAGHTVYANGMEVRPPPDPVGHPASEASCVIGNGVVVDPQALFAEVDELKRAGIDVGDRLSSATRRT